MHPSFQPMVVTCDRLSSEGTFLIPWDLDRCWYIAAGTDCQSQWDKSQSRFSNISNSQTLSIDWIQQFIKRSSFNYNNIRIWPCHLTEVRGDRWHVRELYMLHTIRNRFCEYWDSEIFCSHFCHIPGGNCCSPVSAMYCIPRSTLAGMEVTFWSFIKCGILSLKSG